MSQLRPHSHYDHSFSFLNPLEPEGLVVSSRRNMLKASLAGIAQLSLPGLLRHRAWGSPLARTVTRNKSVILLWMTGGPSHIDTWDVKPDRPAENRGPFSPIRTRLPGVLICEHLPLMAAQLDKFTIIRSVDATDSNHEPDQIFQTGSREAAPRVNPRGHLYPAIGAVVAKHHGANHPGMPPYVAFMRSRQHLAFGGYLGKRYDPFDAMQACSLPIYNNVGVDTGKRTGANLFHLPKGIDFERIRERRDLLHQFDRVRSDLDSSGIMDAMDSFGQQAVEIVTGRLAMEAFDLQREPEAVRKRYGNHLWCQQALLARRLVERGVSFVTLDLSYHPASGTWDTHGDKFPPYGGIISGLKPLLPLFDHLVTTLVSDLGEHGLLNDVLILAMGEFGRTPYMGTQGSPDGRSHWPVVMSMALAGGGLRHGQVIGATENDGGHVKERPVTPGDLAATIYQHMGVPLDTTYLDHTGRPRNVVENNGRPIHELF